MKNYPWWKWACLFAVVAVTFLLLRGQDHYRKTYDTEDLVLEQPDFSAGVREIGRFSTTPYSSLPPGDYQVMIRYQCDRPGNTYAVIAGEGIDLELAGGGLPEGEDTLTVPVKVVENAINFEVTVNYAGAGELSALGVAIRSVGPVCRDSLGVSLLVGLLLLGFFNACKPGKPAHTSRIYLALLALSLGVSAPLLLDSVSGGNDTIYHLGRIEGVYQGLLDGQFPVRIHPNTLYGYGYPSSLMYPELLLYLPALLRMAGISLVTSVHIFLFLLNFATAYSMYFCANRIFHSRQVGLISAVLYSVSVFRLGEMYVDGAYGQVMAMAVLPILIYGVYELFYRDFRKWGYAVLGGTLVLQTHLLTAFWCVITVLAAALFAVKRLRDWQRLKAYLKAGLWTVGINIWFLLPLLDMMGEDLNTGVLKAPFHIFTVPLTLLFRALPGYGLKSPVRGGSLDHVLPLEVGTALLVCNIALLAAFLYNRKKKREMISMKIALACLGVGSVFLIGVTDLVPWDTFMEWPVLSDLLMISQFPWRFLGIAQAFLCLSGGFGLWALQTHWNKKGLIYGCVAVLALFPAAYYMKLVMANQQAYVKGNEVISSLSISTGEYLYKGTDVEELYFRPRLPLAKDKAVSIEQYVKKGTNLRFQYSAQGLRESRTLQLPLLYFPGYLARINGETAVLTKASDRLLTLTIPERSGGVVEIGYSGKPLWNVALFISSLMLAFGFLNYFPRLLGHYRDIIIHQDKMADTAGQDK